MPDIPPRNLRTLLTWKRSCPWCIWCIWCFLHCSCEKMPIWIRGCRWEVPFPEKWTWLMTEQNIEKWKPGAGIFERQVIVHRWILDFFCALEKKTGGDPFVSTGGFLWPYAPKCISGCWSIPFLIRYNLPLSSKIVLLMLFFVCTLFKFIFFNRCSRLKLLSISDQTE